MQAALNICGAAVTLAYPAAVYYGLTRLGTRAVVWCSLPLLVAAALMRMPRDRRARWIDALDALKAPAAVAVLLALTAILNDHRFLLATPVLINVGLLIAFAGSLRSDRPLVERFARLQVDDLSAAEVRYCRRVTIVWSLFFVLNGATAGLLAVAAPLSWWALYTGLIAYLLIGVVAASEYVIRKHNFGRYNGSPVDRLLRMVLPQRSASE